MSWCSWASRAPTSARAFSALPLPSPILHYHGAAFTLWMILLFVQTALISARRVAWHRSLGTIAFCLPPVMVILGVIAAIDALHRKVQIGPLDPAVSSAISLLGITCFAIVIYAAWQTRRKPGTHKRLVLLATISLVAAGFGRLPWRQVGVSPAIGATAGLGLLVLALFVYDFATLRRISRSTLWAGSLTFLTQFLSVPIGMTPAWHAFAGMLERTVGSHL